MFKLEATLAEAEVNEFKDEFSKTSSSKGTTITLSPAGNNIKVILEPTNAYAPFLEASFANGLMSVSKWARKFKKV